MSFFAAGGRYRDRYAIESVEPFLDGELAVARSDDGGRFYLQLTRLKRGTQSRVIQQYRSLDHPLILSFTEVYTEERSLVFIRPYTPLTRLDERLRKQPWDEEETVRWTKKLLQLEKLLNSRPLPMYLLLDPRNMGITEGGELKVFFCGVRNYTALEPVIDWGTWMYMCLSGELLSEPLSKLPADRPFSGPMVRLVERSLKHASVDHVLSQMEVYERKKHSPGLLSRLFGENRRLRERGREVVHPAEPKESLRGENRTPRPAVKGEEKSHSVERIREKPVSEPSVTPAQPDESRDTATAEGRTEAIPAKERLTKTPVDEGAEAVDTGGAARPVSPSADETETPEPAETAVPESAGETAVPPGKKEPEQETGRVRSQVWTAPEKEGPHRRIWEGRESRRQVPPAAEEEPERRQPAHPAQPRSAHTDAPAAEGAKRSGAGPSLPVNRVEVPRSDGNRQQELDRERRQLDRLIRERLIRERREHDRLARQFREYTESIGRGRNP